MTRLTVSVLVGTGLVSSAAVAAANPQDQAYFAKLAAIGFVWPPEHQADVISLGHHICVDKWTGYTLDWIAQDTHNTMSREGFTFEDVTGIVNAAEAAYCPD